MNKFGQISLLILASFFLFVGVKSAFNNKPFAELTDIQRFEGMIYKLHCPHKGAAALSLDNSTYTFNLSVKFRADYCNGNDSQALLGKQVSLLARPVNGEFYQSYEIKSATETLLTPEDIAADQGGSTFGMFLLALLTFGFVAYKSRKRVNT
ncbi:hypothetical protein SAMN05216262_101554 [Colwellia chukchiensis]|uniref:Uncharacterized protein n=1 Tax=Colwellia chukchiensis TaxID=641665 RepID=A0A1H7HND0_9GAMM|nr:hypothetical protein [Colwellia chukchiensis]SEK51856.1 hypothetical protein SAMN05216262_101554 [Colwellia chukchiensis]